MIRQSGETGVIFDTGTNQPDQILQRKELDGWRDYMPDGKPLGKPQNPDRLPPGVYRMISKKGGRVS